MGFLMKRFSSPDEPAMKTIVYRGGVVTFRIPGHWVEEYSDMEGGTFYEDRPDSGTLRLKIITMATPKELQPISALDLLQVVVSQLKNENVECTTTDRKDGNAVLKYEEAGSERGRNLTVFYWVVSNPLPPRHARAATFSYTILAEQRNRSQTQYEVAMLEAEIEAAKFSPEFGK
ncbi:MAG: hypothetical protein ABSE87_01690 [Terracidiphilus sp.]|jgi:hypothetical protein